MAVLPLCNETLVHDLLIAMEPEPSTNGDGTQRIDDYTKYPQWDLHLVVRGERAPNTITVSVAAPVKPEFVQGQVPVFANLHERSGVSKRTGNAYAIVSADSVRYVNPAEFTEAVTRQRDRALRGDTRQPADLATAG